MSSDNGAFDHLLRNIPEDLLSDAADEAASDRAFLPPGAGAGGTTDLAFRAAQDATAALEACGVDARTRASGLMLALCETLADAPEEIDDTVLAALGDIARGLAALPRAERVRRLHAFAQGRYPTAE